VVSDPATKNTGLARVSTDGGPSELLFELPKTLGKNLYAMEVAPDGSSVYLLLEAADHPTELWRVEGATPRKLLSLNPELDGVRLGKSRLIEYRGFDGQTLRTSVVLPPWYRDGDRLPTLVEVYAGSVESDRLHCFNGSEGILHPQLLAARGYAIVYPDMPQGDRDLLRQLPGLVMPAVDELVRLGIADPKRVAVMGNSYGGYSTLGLLVQTSLFRAGVVNAGFSSLISAYLSMDRDGNATFLGWAESGQGRMGGTPWEARDTYIENSPLFYLDRVRTPLLLTCGSEDTVPTSEAEAVFVGLRRLGRAVELRVYEGEDHWPGMWTEAAYRDLHDRVLSWFDRWLSN
jgi:dipeptidyl aminopeptidase/acylaminoacyl peptidase